jgi:hypothetical protein
MTDFEPSEAEILAELGRVQGMLGPGMALEGQIYGDGQKIREQAKAAYPDGLLDARMLLVGVLARLLTSRSAQPGQTSKSISERLTRICAFMQGVSLSESTISEAQYIKASGVLKQDLELLANVCELRKGQAQYGRTPNVKHAPEGMRRYYGELNDVAHISKEDLLQPLLSQLIEGNVTGISPLPVFNKSVAIGMYELHVFILFEMVREAMVLFAEMYGPNAPEIGEVATFMLLAADNMEKAGFKMELTK